MQRLGRAARLPSLNGYGIFFFPKGLLVDKRKREIEDDPVTKSKKLSIDPTNVSNETQESPSQLLTVKIEDEITPMTQVQTRTPDIEKLALPRASRVGRSKNNVDPKVLAFVCSKTCRRKSFLGHYACLDIRMYHYNWVSLD